jgi:hypothetical protein
MEIRFTLLSDGSSDKALIPIIHWALLQNTPEDTLIQPEWADLYYSSRKLNSLQDRIVFALENFPCDILFVHRDTESSFPEDFESRLQEVRDAWHESNTTHPSKLVPVIPVRMTESWLLINESAIRKASGNTNGTIRIDLPRIADLESLPDPKKDLMQLIREASGLKKRNLRKLNVNQSVHLVAEYILDYLPLRGLGAFRKFEIDLRAALTAIEGG